MKKAKELMAHQEQIERDVAERWENAGSQEPWAAQRIPSVTIEPWGSFPFVLARVADAASGRKKLLLRGRNRLSEQQVARALEKEVAAEAASQKLPPVKVEILGTGMMQWSRDRDRCLNVSGTAVLTTQDPRLRSKEDIGRAAGALAQTGLSVLHTVTVHAAPLTGRQA